MAAEQSVKFENTLNSGIWAHLPTIWIPYLELARIHKPFAILLTFLPAFFGILLAASTATPVIAPSRVLHAGLILFVNSAMVRAIGCTWNDILDRDIDIKIPRTRLRPLPRGAITRRGALTYLIFQILVEIGFLQLLPTMAFHYTLPLFVLVGFYPLAKRITVYTQIPLAFAVSWGILLAFPVLGIKIQASNIVPIGSLCAFEAALIVGADFVYAHEDLQADRKEGVNSMAVRHEKHAKMILAVLATIQVASLWTVGAVIKANQLYYISFLGSIVSATSLVYSVDFQSPKDCEYWFKSVIWMTGAAVSIGLLSEYISKLRAI